MVSMTQAIEDCLASEFRAQQASQASVGTEGGSARIAGTGPALVIVTVGDYSDSVARVKGVVEQPFKGTPGRMDFYRPLKKRIVAGFDVGVSSANMRKDDDIIILKGSK